MQRAGKDAQLPQFPDFRVHVFHCGILINYRKVPEWSMPRHLQANERAGISVEMLIARVEWDFSPVLQIRRDEPLPDSQHSVPIQRTVIADDRQLFCLRLSNQHTVKGIFVWPWQ